MTSRNQYGWIGVAITAVSAYLFFFHVIAFVLILAAIILGFPVGLIVHWARAKRRKQ